jgi:hypothetical protein
MSVYKLGTLEKVMNMQILTPFFLERKRTFMIKKFGKLKTLVLRGLHQKAFIDKMKKFFSVIKRDPLWLKYHHVDRMYLYMNNNLDIVNEMGHTFVLTSKNKIDEFNRLFNNRFLKHSHNLGFVCNSEDVCTEHTSHGFFLCPKHLKLRYEREVEIQNSLKQLCNNSTDIIIRYELGSSYW